MRTFPELSAKKPAFVVAIVVAFARLPTSIEPAEFKVTTPPVKVVAPICHPPIAPSDADIEPLITIIPLAESTKKLDELIKIFPSEPLTKDVGLPNENFEALIIISVPSNSNLPAAPLPTLK